MFAFSPSVSAASLCSGTASLARKQPIKIVPHPTNNVMLYLRTSIGGTASPDFGAMKQFVTTLSAGQRALVDLRS
jgi:hypothetical protein